MATRKQTQAAKRNVRRAQSAARSKRTSAEAMRRIGSDGQIRPDRRQGTPPSVYRDDMSYFLMRRCK